MTIRVLLQKLHRLAGEVGIDSPVEVRGLARRVSIFDVLKGSEDEKPAAVINVRLRVSKKQAEERQLGYHNARYRRLKEQGLCTRCAKVSTGGKYSQCRSCRCANSRSRLNRYYASQGKQAPSVRKAPPPWSDDEVQLLRNSKKLNMEYWEIARTLNHVFNNQRTDKSVKTKWLKIQ